MRSADSFNDLYEFLHLKSLALTHWGRDKMDAISQTTFSSAFSWMKMFEISVKISLKFVPKGAINNIPALVQIMAWSRSGDKPLFEPMMVGLLTQIYVTRPQWVKYLSMYGQDVLCGIFKGTYGTPHKISSAYCINNQTIEERTHNPYRGLQRQNNHKQNKRNTNGQQKWPPPGRSTRWPTTICNNNQV